ncbi:hypothetical protein ACA910_021528 [Epithemia clementina (nom. ined.)]
MWSFFGYKDDDKAANPRSKHTSLDENAEIDNNSSEDEALECDYEKNCTALYKHIEEEDWKGVTKYLETGYWPGNFFADPIPPADQVRTWVTRFNPNNATGVRWSQLPLHLAIVVEAPYEVVGSLIELYPQAVRCTDDQHMLPLHLAMRHGSSDNIVDLLLAAFPEAVNAKGKNDRTPIECAVRGPNKVRARILGTFVERAKAKAAKSATVSYSREVAHLRSRLEEKESELGEVKSKLSALDAAKAALEQDLMTVKSEDASAAGERSASADAAETEAEIQKQIVDLEQEKILLEEAQERASEEEKKLIDELERVQAQVANSKTASPEDLLALKEEIEALKTNRMRNQEKASAEVEEMKKHIAEELSKADGYTKEELKTLHENIVELHRVASTEGGRDEDISTLKEEVESLRKELQQKEEAAKLKVELSVLKEALADELKDSESKTQEQTAALIKALESLKLSELDNKSLEELRAMKMEYKSLHAEVKERRLADKMTEDVVTLRRRVNELDDGSIGKDTKQDLEIMKKTLDSIKIAELQGKTNEELLSINQDLALLKEQLKDTEELVKLRNEFGELKLKLETELKQSRNNKRRDTTSLKAAVQKMKNYETKSKLELVALKFELEAVQDHIKASQQSQEIKDDVSKVKSEVQKLIPKASGTAKQELTSIHKSLDMIDVKKLEAKTTPEAVSAAGDELSKAKKKLADQELGMRLKSELKAIRKTIGGEVARILDIDEKKDVSALNAALGKISDGELDRKTTKELISTKEEMTAVVRKMKEKKRVSDDIDAIKVILDDLLKKKEGSVKDDLMMMKGTVDAIDLDDLDSDNVKEWEDLKSQIVYLKKELEDADIADKTKQDLLNLKEALNSAIAESDGRTKEELAQIKAAVDAIDVSQMDSDKREEWVGLKTEIDELKRELKIKECESLTAAIQGKLKYTRGAGGPSKIEISRANSSLSGMDQNFTAKSYAELVATKQKLKSILADMPKDESTPADAALKKLPSKEALPPKGSPAATIERSPSIKKSFSREKSATKSVAKDKSTKSRRGFFGLRKTASKDNAKNAKTQSKTELNQAKASSPAKQSITDKKPPLPTAKASPAKPQASAEDRDTVTEEKKEDDEARSSPPPVASTRSQDKKTQEKRDSLSFLQNVPIARTASKVKSVAGEVELVDEHQNATHPVVETVVTGESDFSAEEEAVADKSSGSIKRCDSRTVDSGAGGEVETVFIE